MASGVIKNIVNEEVLSSSLLTAYDATVSLSGVRMIRHGKLIHLRFTATVNADVNAKKVLAQLDQSLLPGGITAISVMGQSSATGKPYTVCSGIVHTNGQINVIPSSNTKYFFISVVYDVS